MPNAVNETTTTQGGYAVPVEYVKEIFRLMGEYNIAEKVIASHIAPTSSGHLAEITVNPTISYPTEGLYVLSGEDSRPTWDRATYTLKRWGVQVYIYDDWAEDTFASAQTIIETMVETLAEDLDRCVFLGDGSSGYNSVTGLSNITAGLTNVIDLGLNHLTYDKIVQARKTIRQNKGKVANLSIVVSPSGEADIINMKDDAGRLLLSSNVSSSDTIKTGLIGTILGMPVYVANALTPYETSNSKGIAFMIDSKNVGRIVKRYTGAKQVRERDPGYPREILSLYLRMDLVALFPKTMVRFENIGI